MNPPLRRRHLLVPIIFALVSLTCDSPQSDPTASLQERSGPAPLYSSASAVEDRYIIVFNEDVSDPAVAARQMNDAAGGQLHFTYTSALKGFAATLPEASIERIRRDPNVAYIAEDGVVKGNPVENAASWGLDRIDQRSWQLNGKYNYTATGAGVTAYIIDSGIRTTHEQFGGRASVGADFIGDGFNGQDCAGHGTHVAGTVGGVNYGVAKAVNLVAVRVLDCNGDGTNSGVIAGIDWVRNNAVFPAVVNMSLGGPKHLPGNQAVQNAIAAGIPFVISAGNANTDACNASPASTPNAITVGATTNIDVRASFSNFGPCVDIFAPGEDIISASNGSDVAIASLSGTSMAAPHVAGVVALYLEGAPTATPAQVSSAVYGSATYNELFSIGHASPNLMLYSPLTASTIQFSINPMNLSFTFVRTLLQSSVAAAQVPQQWNAARGGPVKTATAGQAGTVYAAATSTTVATTFVLRNFGSSALEWKVESDQPWLSATPGDGALTTNSTTLVSATVNSASLTPGSHWGYLSLIDQAHPRLPQDIQFYASVVEATPLSPGTPLTGLTSSVPYSVRYFEFVVPPGMPSLVVATTGGTGDVDLYVRFNDAPSYGVFDCRPYLFLNEETCVLDFPSAGTYYVMLDTFEPYTGLTLSATLGGPPSAPSAVVGAAVSETRIDLNWTDDSGNETEFQVSRQLFSNSTGTYGPWQSLGSTAGISYEDNGVRAGLKYRYGVRACNQAGCSGTTPSPQLGTPGIAKPIELTAAAVSGTAILLTWLDASHNETSYRLQVRSRPPAGTFGPFSNVGSFAPNRVRFTHSGLSAGYEYEYRLRACTDAACSSPASSGIIVLPSVPAAPTGAAAAIVSPTSVNVQWTDASPNESTFNVQHRFRDELGVMSPYATVATLDANVTEFTHTGLTPNRQHQWLIRACNAAGCSTRAYTSPLVLATIPSAPAGLAAVPASATTAEVTWSDLSDNETKFQLFRRSKVGGGGYGAFTLVHTAAPNAEAFSDTGLVSGTTYQYRIRSCNSAGCSVYNASAASTQP